MIGIVIMMHTKMTLLQSGDKIFMCYGIEEKDINVYCRHFYNCLNHTMRQAII